LICDFYFSLLKTFPVILPQSFKHTYHWQDARVTQGAKIAQLSLKFGANDMGSTMIEENVVGRWVRFA